MASSSQSSAEEQFLCSICLEVFSEPVSTPCGHNFCKRCISQAWDSSVCSKCPLCNKIFSPRPELCINTLLSEIITQFKQKTSVSVSDTALKEVQCDVCSEPRLKAVKSCLLCESSFCESHLQPHRSVPRLKNHQLTEPVQNLESRMCPKHHRPLQLFCSTDQTCVCIVCGFQEHRSHQVFTVEQAYDQTQSLFQVLLEQREDKVEKIQRRLELSEAEKTREEAIGDQTFTALIEFVQRRRDLFLEQLQQQQRNNQRQAQDLLQQLQREMNELEKSRTEALTLSPVSFLQRCPALPPAGFKEWSSVTFDPQTYKGSASRALSELNHSLNEDLSKLFIQAASEELRSAQQFAVDVTLDPDTANPYLALSEDLKQVHDTDECQQLPYSPLRFEPYSCVLGKQSFSSGRFYFEVQVKGKTKWTVGVAQESIHRKGLVFLSTVNGLWTICLREGQDFTANENPPVPLSTQKPPERIGVFVDYEQGLVSFYDVHSADLLHSFTACSFREKLFPYFNPCDNARGTNSAPLIISTVDTDSAGAALSRLGFENTGVSLPKKHNRKRNKKTKKQK